MNYKHGDMKINHDADIMGIYIYTHVYLIHILIYIYEFVQKMAIQCTVNRYTGHFHRGKSCLKSLDVAPKYKKCPQAQEMRARGLGNGK